ncbi:MAG: protoheme IX farnesyltransferase [Alphaproteobacteria bacterium]|nr:protoheme IX farnesyltransferase [Alphaproteobacteria bacterium]
MPFKSYVVLLKLRIGAMIALSAVMGYVAIAREVRALDIVALALAMALGSAAASVFNHFYDRDIDRLMKRTAGRPLALGLLPRPGAVLPLAAALLIGGLALALLAFNLVVAIHLFLGAFVYAVVYTVWLKRRTWINIVIGGAAGSFAVLAGGAAVDPAHWALPTMLAVTLFLWTPSHFWSLAILLREDYARAGVPMLPVLIGDARTARAILANSVLLVGSAALPWATGHLGNAYGLISTLLGAALLAGNVKLARTPSPVWARRNFFGSMYWLVGLFLAVLVDVNWP